MAATDRDQKLSDEAAWLQNQRIDLVVSDVVPLACAAAHAAGIPSVCVSNFSWGEIRFPVSSIKHPAAVLEFFSQAEQILIHGGKTLS